ncbi:MAG: 2,3-bisphosphoglycerate-independent phosphoglycerate mutase [Patescibacteria group bacterium]
MKKPVALIILDGWGYREETKNNAIAASKKPFFDYLWNAYPHSLLKASGSAVGLPDGQMGNSEVGHMTIGTGKPADTDLTRIDKAIASGEFDTSPAFLSLFNHVKKYNSTLHVQGLLSPGGVHSHQNHLYAFLRLAKKNNVPKVAIHVFTDGRDTPPQSASEYIKELEKILAGLGPNFFIATISGRYYAMDRDNNWDRLAKVEMAIFDCKGNVCEIKPSAYIEEQYKNGKSDELMEPIVCATPEGSGCAIKNNDAVFFFNFRADRARMLSQKMMAIPKSENIMFVTLTEYCIDYTCAMAFPPNKVETTLGKEISAFGLSQARIAETEKFAHATYFLNGGLENPYEKEQDILIPSRKDIKTHDQAPEMRADSIADAAIKEIERGTDFIFINFANPDMVGHTANVPAIITAIETTDKQLERVIKTLGEKGGIALITADHGNAEINVDSNTGIIHTSHTTSPVPCIITDSEYSIKDGALYDIAPTILDLLGIDIPKSMTGKSLITKK